MKKGKLGFYLLVIAMFVSGCSDDKEQTSPHSQVQGAWNIQLIDEQTQKEILEGTVVVSETQRTYEITKDAHIISLPSITSGPTIDNFPMGYTLLTYAKGYLPRIDHNLMIANNETTTLTLEMQSIIGSGNTTYLEYFHPSTMNTVFDFIQKYLGNDPYRDDS